MLSRFAVEPIPHLTARLQDVKRVSKQSTSWGHTREKQRRNASFMRFIMPVRLRLSMSKKRVHTAQNSRRKGSSTTEKAVLRRVNKRELKHVLPSSHVWSAKRMKMDRSSWFETTIAMHSAQRSVEANVETAMHQCGVHDLSYEKWIELKTTAEETMIDLLSQIFDANDLPDASELSGTRYVIHMADAFPAQPICPVRLHHLSATHLQMCVHSYCARSVFSALQEAADNINAVEDVQVRQLENVSTFLLVGPKLSDCFDNTVGSSDNLVASDKTSMPRCPLSGREMGCKQLESYLFGSEFGQLLAYGSKSFVDVGGPPAVQSIGSRSAVKLTNVRPLDFVLGNKLRCTVPARIILLTDEDQALKRQFWTRLCHNAACCLGIFDMERLYLMSRLPIFPRDFPDTPACIAYWHEREEKMQRRSLNQPKSKRGTSKPIISQPAWNTVAGINIHSGSIAVARGWHNVSFFFGPEAEHSELHPNLLVQVRVESPRSAKFGTRIKDFSTICLPSHGDYQSFCQSAATKGVKWAVPERTAQRQIIGLVSSCSSGANQSFGVGHIVVEGLVKLLAIAEKEGWKQKKRRLFVLVQDNRSSEIGKVNWGVAFLSVVAS